MDERTTVQPAPNDDLTLPAPLASMPDIALDRRALIARGAQALVGLGLISLLSGCASSGKGAAQAERRTTDQLLNRWGTNGSAAPQGAGKWSAPKQSGSWSPSVVKARSTWAGEAPVPRLMERMLPVTRITLHHDGMGRFTSTGEREVAARLEAIRRGHRGRNFGDIGYHYVVDPAGRVWEGRPLTWQGAHVANQNEGNLGICCIGNFEEQSPTEAQLRAVEAFTISQMRRFKVQVSRVYTHREMAPTACPGRNLQPKLLAMRTGSGALARA